MLDDLKMKEATIQTLLRKRPSPWSKKKKKKKKQSKFYLFIKFRIQLNNYMNNVKIINDFLDYQIRIILK